MGVRPEPAWRGKAAQRSSLACCRICAISSAALALGAAEDALILPTVRHPGPVAKGNASKVRNDPGDHISESEALTMHGLAPELHPTVGLLLGSRMMVCQAP